MDHAFWHERWETGRIGFHEARVNGLLAAHFPAIAPPPGAHIFVPLCGVAHDMAWLAAQGYRVTGIDLSRTAIDRFLVDHALTATRSDDGPLHRAETARITLYAGDVFALTAAHLAPVDLIYDRAALVALPADLRPRYATHLMEVTGAAPQFLITFDHDGPVSSGPPFSVPEAEVRRLYGERYGVASLAERPIDGPLAERCTGVEVAWRLAPDGD
ncbi:MAG: thiopurine S-methyltransferase [Pseudomonadota bacterium]